MFYVTIITLHCTVLYHCSYLLVEDLTENPILHVRHLLGSLLRLLLLLRPAAPALGSHLGHPLGPDLCQLVVTHPVSWRPLKLSIDIYIVRSGKHKCSISSIGSHFLY